MNFAKISGAAFMLFILISAPFFAIQTTQDGINRVLADDYSLIIQEILEGYVPVNLTFIDGTVYSASNGTVESPNSSAMRTNIVEVNFEIYIEHIDRFTFLNMWDENMDYIGCLNGYNYNWFGACSSTITTNFYTLPSNVKYIAFNGWNETYNLPGIPLITTAIPFNVFTTQELETEKSDTIIIQKTYYEIFENARLADYQNVDSFTNIFYTIPYMATSFAEAYNRFINFTDNLNPFRVKDESTGEFRDQTPSEVMDSWPARIIVWFRRFTD